MSCQEYREKDAYLADEDPDALARAASHLSVCPDCRKWKQEYEQMIGVYRATITEEPAMTSVFITPRHRRLMVPLLAAAATVLLAFGIALLQRDGAVPVEPRNAGSPATEHRASTTDAQAQPYHDILDVPKDEIDTRVEKVRGAIARLKIEVSSEAF